MTRHGFIIHSTLPAHIVHPVFVLGCAWRSMFHTVETTRGKKLACVPKLVTTSDWFSAREQLTTFNWFSARAPFESQMGNDGGWNVDPLSCLDGFWERWSLVPRWCLECWSPSVPRCRLELWSRSVPPRLLKTGVRLPKSKLATHTGCIPCFAC